MNTAPSFVHLHIHSQYSLVDGLIRIGPLMEQAAALDLPALAMTEQGNLFSLVKFYRQAQEAGIKPVIGCELRIQEEGNELQNSNILFLCQNTTGYHNLTRLITRSFTEGQVQGQPHIRRHWLDEGTDGLIALSCASDGDVGKALLNGNMDSARTLLGEWQSRFPDRYYLELQRTGRNGENLYIDGALELAESFDIPVVATNDVRFLRESDFDAHEARVCIQQGRVLNDPRRPRHYSNQQYLKSPEQMLELFRDIPEAIENSVLIAQRCNVEFTFGEYYLPDFPVPEGHDQDSWLHHETEQGLERVFTRMSQQQNESGETDRKKYRQRLKSELEVIVSMGFSGYFLIVADFIRWAKEQRIPVGPGRGSGAGSLVAYALDITELDPLEYDLLFERFLNPERVSLPDFDVDFCMERRDEVIEYVSQRYGRDHVSQIITYGTMAAKAVVRDVGRVLGHPYGFIDQIAKLIPFDLNMTLERALNEEESLKQRYRDEEDVHAIIDLAMSLEGLARNAGKHAGGIVIAPKPLTEYMPLYCEQGTAVTSTQFDMGDVEAIGLVKFDFLGLRTLTIIDWAIRDVNSILLQDGDIDIHDIPMDDPKTFELIRKTDTTAVFQLESDGMKKLIKRLHPDNFDDLIALVALFRPGPMDLIPDFIERKHGRSRVAYLDPRLEPILSPTYGVMVYQEQVMQIAQVIGGYTLGSADLLRRAMGKKKPEEMAKQRDIFVSGALQNGVAERTAHQIFDLMEKFAGYGFNKSHSAAYALLAYQTAWLKAHYPAAFMAAVLSSDMDNTDKIVTLREEVNRMGLRLLPPSVNESEYMFTVVDKDTIRFGLGAIKGAGSSAIENILAERKAGGNYSDLFELCRRIDTRRVNKRVMEALIRSGALDGLGPDRSVMLASLERAMQFAEQFTANSDLGQDDLFGLNEIDGGQDNDRNAESSQFLPAKPWSEHERLRGEKMTLGFYLHGHPITFYEEELRSIISKPLNALTAGNSAVIAGYIEAIRTRPGRRGRMAEICLDDRTARVYAVLYSEVYQQYRNVLQKDKLVILSGEVVEDDYYEIGYSFRTERLFDLQDFRSACGRLILSVEREEIEKGVLADIKSVLESHKSTQSPVLVHYRNGDITGSIKLGPEWKVDISEQLLEDIRELLGQERVKVEYQNVKRFLYRDTRENASVPQAGMVASQG
ncbi:MAG: DNA polymerase III subunit alpha [Gammaproteobacteria bacterium]